MHLKEHGRLQIDNLIALKKEGDFTCDVCGKVLKGRKAILRHVTYQHFNPDLSCDLCPKTFKRIGDLRIHMNHAHLKFQPYHCDVCEYKTAFQTNLRSHKKTHREVKVPKPRVSCQICGREMVILSQHMSIVHGFHYKKCCESFKNITDLARWVCGLADCVDCFKIKLLLGISYEYIPVKNSTLCLNVKVIPRFESIISKRILELRLNFSNWEFYTGEVHSLATFVVKWELIGGTFLDTLECIRSMDWSATSALSKHY